MACLHLIMQAQCQTRRFGPKTGGLPFVPDSLFIINIKYIDLCHLSHQSDERSLLFHEPYNLLLRDLLHISHIPRVRAEEASNGRSDFDAILVESRKFRPGKNHMPDDLLRSTGERTVLPGTGNLSVTIEWAARGQLPADLPDLEVKSGARRADRNRHRPIRAARGLRRL